MFNRINLVSENLRASTRVLLLALLGSMLVFGLVGYLHFEDHIPAYQLLDDTSDYAGVKWYTGLLSNLVILLWCASAAVCAFVSRALRDSPLIELQELRRFLVLMAVANVWMTFDDLFLIHEQLARLLFGRESQHTGEGLILGLYAALIGTCVWKFRKAILMTEALLFIGALASLAASIAIDVGFQLEMDGRNFFRETVLSVSWGAPVLDIAEEILKLNGAVLWFIYLSGTGLAGVLAFANRTTESGS